MRFSEKVGVTLRQVATTLARTAFAEWLEAQMHEHRERPADVARGARIPQSSISAWLNSGVKPTMETAAKLAAHYGIETADVLRVIDPSADLVPASEDAIIEEVRRILRSWSPDEQREFALPAIALAESLLRRARREPSP